MKNVYYVVSVFLLLAGGVLIRFSETYVEYAFVAFIIVLGLLGLFFHKRNSDKNGVE